MSQNTPLTPGEEPEPTSPSIDYSPSTVPYHESFENALMQSILHPSNTLLHQTSTQSVPLVTPSDLPIPLNSPLRQHPSPIPGLFLTHANGYHTGGPGPSSST